MKLTWTLFTLSIYTLSFSQSLTVEKIWQEHAFYAKGIDGFRSTKDGNHFTLLNTENQNQTISLYKITEPDKLLKTLVLPEELTYKEKRLVVDDYYFNDDETKILLITQKESVYRRSFTAVYFLFDLTNRKIQPLDENHQPQTLANYSPDGKKVSYIYQNDIYVLDIASGKSKQLTTDGNPNEVINGRTDWVYEEEFSFTQAYSWSPDSKYIGYLKFIEKEVKEFNLMYYGQLYPEMFTYKYPKAGEDNSKVSLHLVQVNSAKNTMVDLGEYEYIPRLKWSEKNNQLIVQTLNRRQNHLKYHLVEMTEKKPIHRVFFEEKSNTYVEIDNNLLILSDGKGILRTSESDGFNHIYKLSFDGQSTQITNGNWDVIEFYGADEVSGEIFYASAENGPIHKSIYKIKFDGTSKILLSKETGHNEAEFTNGMKYFIKTYSNANTPPIQTLCNNSGKELLMLEDNRALVSKLTAFNLSKKEFIKFKSGNIELNGWMIKPANFIPSQRYPVYITIYGGPGHNEVSDSWDGNDYMYHQLLAQKGYIVVSVDPRGTMYRGESFKKSTYLQLGKLELEDFCNVASELQKLPFVDPNRIGIQGWSYGGFMASLAMTKASGIFKMGVAIAPVTNWRFYDNIYTERFMRTPDENLLGYEENSPINYANELRGKYLIVHGSGDDNVHYQNTIEMINALIKANKQFDLFIYPNRNHGIYGGSTRNHLFNMLLEYTLKNL